ncbi:hypothetical protein ABLN87_17005 [Ruegeria sp. SCPT10]
MAAALDFEGLAYFRQVEDGAFVGNDPARGPWSPITAMPGRSRD